MPSVKKNFAWSTILTVAGYLFPIITFPYVTRVLGVENLGAYNFSMSVVSYFSIFAMMGMAVVGVREVAKAKDNKEELSKVFSSLIVLNLLTTFVATIVLVLLINIIPSFKSHSSLLYIGVAQLFCGSLLIEWLFKGLEDFQFITIRAIAIRCLYVIAVFVFVREAEDYFIYFVLTAAVTVVNALVNIFYSRRFVSFSLRNLNIAPYVKPFIILGVYTVLTNMYGSFNVVFLGDRCGDVEVGYYTTATKLYGIIMSVFTSFTTVMMPRMSSLLSEGKNEKFKEMTSKSIDFLLLFCIPVIVFSVVFAPQIIRIIAGPGYEGAILPMRIVMPLMLIIGYEQIIVIQMLMPLGKDNAILFNSIIGAIIALLLNFTIVPLLASVGSAIVWCCCEFAVAISAQVFVTKYTKYRIPLRKILRSVVAYIPAIFICSFINSVVVNWILSIIIGMAFIGVYLILVEVFIIKNPLLLSNFALVRNRFLLKK